MAVTGRDKTSLLILDALNKGTKVKDIPFKFPVSLNQAKRLSRYNNMLNAAAKHLPAPLKEKLEMLGVEITPPLPSL